MLLGDPDPPFPTDTFNSPHRLTGKNPSISQTSFNGGLDVLHAASAALIDGTGEILIDSDFENTMKVLTSWIPIRDEDLLMRVAKAEWKANRKRR